jgi:L-arabinose isomerase
MAVMAIKPKVGVLVMALLEDDYNKTAHVRPMAQKVADKIGGIIARYAEVVCPPLVEEEHQAQAAAQMFNAAGVDLIVAVEVAYTKGAVPVRCFLDTNAPILIWNTQQVEFLPEDADFDLIMVNSGMAGVPEMTSALLRMGRSFWMVTSLMDDPEGHKRLAEYIAAAGAIRRLKTARIAVFGHAFELVDDSARPDDVDPEFRVALALAHPDLGRLLRHRLPGEGPQPELAPPLDEPGDRDPSRLELPRRQPARLQGLEPVFSKGQRASPPGLAPHPAALALAEFDFLRHQHD